MSTFTAADLGVTGPHLIAHDLDSRDLVVHEVLGYERRWDGRCVAWFTYRAPGVLEPIECAVPVDRMRVAA